MKSRLSENVPAIIECYNSKRFIRLADVLPEEPSLELVAPSLQVLLLADDSHPSSAVQDHIQGIKRLSRNYITIINPRVVRDPTVIEDDKFDVILIHYSIYILHETYLPLPWQIYIASFPNGKAIIREDEYQQINSFKRKMSQLGVGVVFSNLNYPPQVMKWTYEEGMFPNVWFFSCLPGYISKRFKELQPPPISNRPFDIVYRGRTLPPQLGLHAQDKRIIGEQMLAAAGKYGLRVDISSEESDRIYGGAWPKFLMDGRAMLGVEGGASIFDFDGTLTKKVEQYYSDHPKADFKEVWSRLLKGHEENVVFKSITPKFFEAIAAKTALVLYPGQYSGILERDRHYIVLERDGSNLNEVVTKLRDDEYLQQLVDRTFSEVLFRTDLTKQFYVNQMDKILAILKIKIDGEANHSPIQFLRDDLALAWQKLNSTRQELESTKSQLTQTVKQLEAPACQLMGIKQLIVLLLKETVQRFKSLFNHVLGKTQ